MVVIRAALSGEPNQFTRGEPNRFAYPVFLDLHEVLVLVVGAGRVGAHKIDGLLAAGARVRLVALEVSPDIPLASIDEVHERTFTEADLDGVRLVVAATGGSGTDAAVSLAAKQRGIWTNAADQPADCDFILPAIVRSGRVTAAISTGGASPILAQEVRNSVGRLLTPELAALADTLAIERRELHAQGRSTEDTELSTRTRAAIAEVMIGNNLPE